MLITTGPPKCGTTALRRLSIEMGYKQLPGALVYGEWKRHTAWAEKKKRLPKWVVNQHIVRLSADMAYKALSEGWALHGHIPPPTPHHIPTIVILRDPRAALVSWFRAKQKSKAGLIRAKPDQGARRSFRRWLTRTGGQRAADYIRPIYDGWLAEEPRDTLLIVWYEDFFTEATMQLIANFTGRSVIDPLTIYGTGSKFTGRPTEVEKWYDAVAQAHFDNIWSRVHVQSVGGKGRDKNRGPFSRDGTISL